jgi:Tfp pilus assembly protein PilZ
MEEQRQAIRVDIDFAVSLQINGHGTRQKALRSGALNTEGIQLLLPGRIPSNERVELELSLPNQPSACNVSGEVAWIEHLGDVYEGYYLVGIRFVELAESARHTIETLMADELSKLKPLPSEAG